jgi:purine-binding chemotaxis protein CheW
MARLVAFSLDEQRYALPLTCVERVVRTVEITPLPQAPEIILGVINVRGRIISVLDLRRRFRLPPREICPEDHFIIACTRRRPVVLVADTVSACADYPDQAMVAADSVLPQMPYVQGIVKLPDELILIHDLDRFLSLDEEEALEISLVHEQSD